MTEEYFCDSCNVNHDRFQWSVLGMLCGRCGYHSGNNTQGHYWGLCKVWLNQGRSIQSSIRDYHFCCPDDCELETNGS